MIRQAQTYLVGAVSGTTLIVAAVVAFVLLISFQALRDWPLAALGGGDSDGAVAPVRPVGTGAGAAGGEAANVARSAAGSEAGGQRDPGSARNTSPAAGAPVATAPGTGPTPAGNGETNPASPGSSGSGGGSTKPSGGGNGGGGGDGGGANSPSTSETVTGAVNDTVSGVDQATGGALGKTGVTETTEEVVNGVAGPESPVGKTVDKTVEQTRETVGGLLGGGH